MSPRADNCGEARRIGAGEGEITLDLGEPTTRAARILRCEVDEAGQLSGLDVGFETMPGQQVDLRIALPDASTLSTVATLSNGVVIESRAERTGGWSLNFNDGQLSIRAAVGAGADTIPFMLVGTCPAR